MSIILEALKKSENERQRQTGPGLATVPERAARTRRSVWPALIVILLAINTAILGFFLLRGSDAPASTPVATSGRPDTTRPARRDTPVTGSPTETRRENVVPPAPSVTTKAARRPDPVGVTGNDTPAREVRSLEELAASPAAAPAPRASGAPGARDDKPERETKLAAAEPVQPSYGDVLPTATELYLRGELSGPPLNLDLHVYYADPARRVVFVNGRKYREGERLSSGPMVREIVPDGVVLADGAKTFLLQSE